MKFSISPNFCWINFRVQIRHRRHRGRALVIELRGERLRSEVDRLDREYGLGRFCRIEDDPETVTRCLWLELFLDGTTPASFCLFSLFSTTILQKNCTLQRNSNSDRRSKARSLTIWPPPPPRSQTLVRNLSQLKKWWQCPVTFSFFRHSYKKLLGLKGQNWRMAVF